MVQKAVNAKTKVDLKFNVMIGDANSHCLRDYDLSHNTWA